MRRKRSFEAKRYLGGANNKICFIRKTVFYFNISTYNIYIRPYDKRIGGYFIWYRAQTFGFHLFFPSLIYLEQTIKLIIIILSTFLFMVPRLPAPTDVRVLLYNDTSKYMTWWSYRLHRINKFFFIWLYTLFSFFSVFTNISGEKKLETNHIVTWQISNSSFFFFLRISFLRFFFILILRF